MNKTTLGVPSSNIYSGLIEIEDFNTSEPNKRTISNQIATNNLAASILETKRKKEQEEMYKTMTLEELREMKLISNTTGRPTSTLTDEKWQKELNVRRAFITPCCKKMRKMNGKFSRESGVWNKDIHGEYVGATNWQEYCSFINDVLRNIESGQVDYCYYIYQILDILKFHYNNLKTKYCDGYWEVWLER